jgi:dedicator of cytokinesis protein 3
MANPKVGFEVAFYRELSILTPLNMAPAMRSPTSSWVAASRSHLASPTPDDQLNGTRVTSPQPNGNPRQDKKRLSLAFLTKGVLMGESEKEKEGRVEEEPEDNHDDASITTSTRSPSKELSRHRLSLSFLHNTGPATPGLPAPEALPVYQGMSQSQSQSQTSLGRTPSTGKRPDTGGNKSMKSESSSVNLKGSMKKRLSFMNMSKKSSKNSVRGNKQQETLVEE